MKMALIALLVLCIVFGCTREASVLYMNGQFVTMDEDRPDAEAVVVKNGTFIAVGTSEDLRIRYPDATIVDLQGRTAMPGIIESHGHLLDLGKSFLLLNIESVATPEGVVEGVAERIRSASSGEWILGWGWDDGAWADLYPSGTLLDAVAPENPVVLRGLHGFATWTNSKALSEAGITPDTEDPANGSIMKHEDGSLKGILTNEAQHLLETHIPPLTPSQRVKALELAIDTCLSHGLTSIHEAKTTAHMLEALRRIKREGRLKARIYSMLDVNDSVWVESWLRKGVLINDRLTVRSIKVFVDGALGSRGAALLEPYSDEPDTRGVIVTSEAALFQWSVKALQAGFQVVTHAIGDHANRITLSAYERAFRDVPDQRDHRFRVEHAQIVRPEDVPRFARSNLVVSMQPPHCTSDMDWVEDRLGAERAAHAYMWRSFLKTGVHLTFNSDFPGETLNPFYGLYAAETRRKPSGAPLGTPSSGWFPAQCVSRSEGLKAYTTEAAYSEFSEFKKGKIREGMLADFIVISKDIRTVESEGLLDLKVEKTFVGGTCVFDRYSSTRDHRR